MTLVKDIAIRLTTDKSRQVVRFGISGLSSTIAYFICVNALVLGLHTDPVIASVVSYAASIVFSYMMQSRFTFRRPNDTFKQIGRFLAISIFGLAISYASAAYFTGFLNINYIFGTIFVCIALPLANYFIFRNWVFVSKN